MLVKLDSRDRAHQSLPVPANDLPAETELQCDGLFFDKNNLQAIGLDPIEGAFLSGGIYGLNAD
jgi:hypothetical protein